MLRSQSKWFSQGYTKTWWKGDKELGLPPLPLHERQAFLATLSKADIEDFFRDWRVWASDYQLPPDPSDEEKGDWDTWLFLAGRGSGKTRSAVEYIQDAVNEGWARRIAIVGQGEDDVRQVMVQGESGFIECAPSFNKPKFFPSVGGGQLIWPNGCTAFIYSIADTEALRGPQFHLGWCDEPMAAPRAQRERALDNLEFCLRLGVHPRLILTTTPKPDPWLREMERDAKDPEKKYFVSRASTYDNAENLPANYLKKITRKYGGKRTGKQEILGLIVGDEEGALWTEEDIDATRRTDLDPFEVAENCNKVIVSVDPNTKGANPSSAARAKKIAHAAGIIVLGAKEKERFILRDRSSKGGPAVWAKAAVQAAKDFDADEIVAENNQGGDMVKILLQQAMETLDFTVPVHLNWAKKSKEGRAEPVAAVYERKEVHHIGPAEHFADLEMQMVYLHEGEDPTNEDFDRVDALVWGLTRLGLKRRSRASSGRAHAGFRSFGDVSNGPANSREIGSYEDVGEDA